MNTKHALGMLIQTATLAALLVAADAQQNQNQNTNPPQNQQSQQTQPAPPPKKKSFWQKVQDASQAGQNVMQQGSSTVQQGRGTIQQTGQQVQNTIQQAPNQGVMQQVPNGVQQDGLQQGVEGAQGAANGFQGGGAGACGPSCFDAGIFQANVSQMTTSQQGGWHVIRMNIQFHNATDQPLILAYHDGSMVMVDNNGNTYIPAGGNPGQLQGMGIDRGEQTDSQFQLGPGQTGYALFSVARGRAANSPVGTGYSYNLTIDELQLQNGALAIPVRMYNLNFPTLVPGTSNASFGSGTPPATGFVGNANRANSAGTVVPQGGAQSVAGQPQVGAQQRRVGVAGQQQGMVIGKASAIGSTAGGTALPQANAQNAAGQPQPGAPQQLQPGVAGQPQRTINGRPVAVGSVNTGTAVPQRRAQNVAAQPQLGVQQQRQIGVAVQQPGMVNAKPAAAVPAAARPTAPVNNAAMRTPVPARAQNVPAARPAPAAPAAKPAATTPPKKAPATTANSK